MTYSIDSGWIVSTTDQCTCGMGRYSEYGHESFCGTEQEAPVEELDAWVRHLVAKVRQDTLAEIRNEVAGIEHWVTYTARGEEFMCFAANPLVTIDELKEKT